MWFTSHTSTIRRTADSAVLSFRKNEKLPLGKDVRYRMKKTKGGYVRLAFKGGRNGRGGKVVEAKPMRKKGKG